MAGMGGKWPEAPLASTADLPQDPPEDPSQDPPKDNGPCQCQVCEPQLGSCRDPGSSNGGCPQLFQER